jgi:uncharacterized membrane protein
MAQNDAVIAVFADRQGAEAAIKKLGEAGLDMKKLTLVGKGYHSEEKVHGFYNTGERVKFWGRNGAFWGGLWGLLFGGLFVTIPGVGPVVVLGYLAAMVGGLSALGAALFSIGIPKDSVIDYETALKADQFLVMAHGSAEEVGRAKAILSTVNPSRIDTHEGLRETPQPDDAAHAGA